MSTASGPTGSEAAATPTTGTPTTGAPATGTPAPLAARGAATAEHDIAMRDDQASADLAPSGRGGPWRILGLLVLAALSVLVGVLSLGGLDLLGRGPLTVAFALSAPGAALVVWSRMRDGALAVVSSVVLSIALVIIVAQVMVLADAWYPETAVGALALASAVSLAARALVGRSARRDVGRSDAG